MRMIRSWNSCRTKSEPSLHYSNSNANPSIDLTPTRYHESLHVEILSTNKCSLPLRCLVYLSSIAVGIEGPVTNLVRLYHDNNEPISWHVSPALTTSRAGAGIPPRGSVSVAARQGRRECKHRYYSFCEFASRSITDNNNTTLWPLSCDIREYTDIRYRQEYFELSLSRICISP